MISRVVTIIILAFFITFSSAFADNKVVLKERLDTVAYGIGMNLGKNLKSDSLYINLDLLKQGIMDVMHDKETVITEEQVMETMMALQKELASKKEAKMQEEAKINKVIADEFLAKNKAKEGVITTASGLQYSIIKKGTGAIPDNTKKVKVHYTGRLINGEVFDSSVERNEPAVFPINGVIKGWTEALLLMPTGSKWMLVIPPDLAYGERGRPPKIAPNSALIFEVELLEVLDTEATPKNDALQVKPMKK